MECLKHIASLMLMVFVGSVSDQLGLGVEEVVLFPP